MLIEMSPGRSVKEQNGLAVALRQHRYQQWLAHAATGKASAAPLLRTVYTEDAPCKRLTKVNPTWAALSSSGVLGVCWFCSLCCPCPQVDSKLGIAVKQLPAGYDGRCECARW